MPSVVLLALTISVLSGLAAILLGQNLTRSIAAVGVSIVGLAVAMLAAGAGFLALMVTTVAALILISIQLFGWMLVDVDRDQLPSTDRMTWLARCLAFLLLGGGLLFLGWGAETQGLLRSPAKPVPFATPAIMGGAFFGPWKDLAALAGLVLSGGLLATLMLLRDDGENR
jgi:NADH:ubiquinone oxidoreductase subunit 6 (subunit J)